MSAVAASPAHRAASQPRLCLSRSRADLVITANVSALGRVDAIYAATYDSNGRTLGYLSTSPNAFRVNDPKDAGDTHTISASVSDLTDRFGRTHLFTAIDITGREAAAIREWLKALPA